MCSMSCSYSSNNNSSFDSEFTVSRCDSLSWSGFSSRRSSAGTESEYGGIVRFGGGAFRCQVDIAACPDAWGRIWLEDLGSSRVWYVTHHAFLPLFFTHRISFALLPSPLTRLLAHSSLATLVKQAMSRAGHRRVRSRVERARTPHGHHAAVLWGTLICMCMACLFRRYTALVVCLQHKRSESVSSWP